MRTVLIAEDRDVSRELTRTILQHLGYVVREARNGAEALAAIRADPPDAVLLDIQMPVMTGFEVLQHLRADKRFTELPVLALTASAMAGDFDKALSAGFSAYLTKPVGISTMRSELARLLPSDSD